MKQDILGNELLELGKMLERHQNGADLRGASIDKAEDDFLHFVVDLAGGVRGKDLPACAIKLLSSSKRRLPDFAAAVLDLEPGTSFAGAIGAARALYVLAQGGEDLIKRRGNYFVRSGGRICRVNLPLLAREMGLLRTAKGTARPA